MLSSCVQRLPMAPWHSAEQHLAKWHSAQTIFIIIILSRTTFSRMTLDRASYNRKTFNRTTLIKMTLNSTAFSRKANSVHYLDDSAEKHIWGNDTRLNTFEKMTPNKTTFSKKKLNIMILITMILNVTAVCRLTFRIWRTHIVCFKSNLLLNIQMYNKSLLHKYY